MPQQQFLSNWSIDYTLQLLRECAHISYGITDEAKYRQIVEQKDKGDPNAEYAYAYLLAYYDIGRHSPTHNPNGKVEGYQLMWDLAQAGHPQACEYLGRMGISFLEKYFPMDEQTLFQTQFRYLKIALHAGLKPYLFYANTLAFQLRKDEAGKLLLTDSPMLDNKAVMQEAVQNYLACAQEEGRSYCLGRMVEAYYHGIGVEKDLSAAAAWAKLVAERFPRISRPSVKFAQDVNNELSANWGIYKSPETEALYEQLTQKIPQSDF